MTAPSMLDAFGHHVWATTRLIDVCIELSPEQLATAVPGTYGSILDTQRHLVGSDTWATEVVPNPNPDLVFAVHNELITKNGILNHENLDFSDLIKDKVSEFVYVFAPLRMKGATGSAGRPIAIV